jgi:hypothetical protein
MYTTEAWVIHEIPAGTKEPARLREDHRAMMPGNQL